MQQLQELKHKKSFYMGACCCTSESKTSSKQNESNQLHKTIEISSPSNATKEPSKSEEIALKTTKCKDEESESMKTRDMRADTQHWKSQTFIILGDLPHDIQGSDFEDDSEDNNGDLYDDDDNEKALPPKQLINARPRKSYVSKYQNFVNTEFGLEPGSTLNGIETKKKMNCWASCDASHFDLRCLEYLKNKKNGLKASGDALYDLLGVDCFEIDDNESMNNQDIDEMLRCIDFGQQQENEHVDIPNVFVLSLRVPFYKKKQRKGLHILLYAKICKDFDQKFGGKKEEDASVKLLKKLLKFEQEQINSFKMTLRIPNVKETTLGTMTKKLVKTMNGKSMAFQQHADFGFVNNGKKNVYVIKFNGYGLNKQMIKGLSTIRSHLQTIDFEIGFHIGAKVKEYLPERMLFCAKISKLNISELMTFDKFYTTQKEEFDKNPPVHSRQVTYVMDDTLD